MTATSAAAVQKKRCNFQRKRKAKADAKLLKKPAVLQALQEKDARILQLQQQLDQKSAEGTKHMHRHRQFEKTVKTLEGKVETLHASLQEAEGAGLRAAEEAYTVGEQLRQAKKEKAGLKRQNTLLYKGHQMWSNISQKLSSPKTGNNRWKSDAQKHKDAQHLRFLQQLGASSPACVKDSATPHGMQ